MRITLERDYPGYPSRRVAVVNRMQLPPVDTDIGYVCHRPPARMGAGPGTRCEASPSIYCCLAVLTRLQTNLLECYIPTQLNRPWRCPSRFGSGGRARKATTGSRQGLKDPATRARRSALTGIPSAVQSIGQHWAATPWVPCILASGGTRTGVGSPAGGESPQGWELPLTIQRVECEYHIKYYGIALQHTVKGVITIRRCLGSAGVHRDASSCRPDLPALGAVANEVVEQGCPARTGPGAGATSGATR